MEIQHGHIDTITIMKYYDFHKPMNVSIIYEDRQEEKTNSHKGEFVLINKVAEILRSIKKALVYYCDIIPRCEDEKRKHRLKVRWLHVKHKLFAECLAVSKEFLIQIGVTDQFIKDIFSNIEQISKVPINCHMILNIQERLLKWIQLKQFAMTNVLSDVSQNYRPSVQATHSHFRSENVTNNLSVENIFASRPPGSQILEVEPETFVRNRNVQNLVNSPIVASCNIKEDNTGWHRIPDSNYSSNGVNEQHITPSPQIIPVDANGMNYNASLLNNPEGVYYNGTHPNSNVMLPQSNQIYTDDTTRRSISRDSGFKSPATPLSPLTYHYDTMQYSSSQNVQHNSNFVCYDVNQTLYY